MKFPLRGWPVLALAFVWLASAPVRAEEAPPGISGVLARVLPTVVNISVRKLEQATSSSRTVSAASPAPSLQLDSPQIRNFVGSGFVIDPAGLIVTNYHVVENAFEITLKFSDGTVVPGTAIHASRIADLALVKVQVNHPLPAAQWGDSDALQVGDQVFAAGNPFGLGISVSAGIVSALNRDIQNSPYDDLIQTDAAINHGNSGGPLFNMQGHVVGVDSDIISPTTGSAGLGFALPAHSAQFVLDQLIKYGEVRPSWIGIKVQQVTPDMAQAMRLDQAQGSVVAWVRHDGPARRAGLQIGDVVLRYNGKAPSDERALLRDIAETHVGDAITLSVIRNNKELDIPVTTQQWPQDQWNDRDAPLQVRKPELVIPRDLGLSLSAIEPAKKISMGLEDGLTGVLITGVLPHSDPAARGLTSGDIILRVWDKPVDTPEAVQASIDAARTEHRNFMMFLVLPKVQNVLGPKWVALQLGSSWL
ncbi:MAG: trypsin-like peptidase domain-containing protein [Rhodopila sp.]